MIKYNVEVHIYGLNSYDADILVKKFRLLDAVYPGLSVQCSLLEFKPNYITFEYEFDNEDDALEFYHIILSVDFNKSEFDFESNPVLECVLRIRNDSYGN